MAVKPRYNAEAEAKANERFEKQIARIYIIWLVGILIGAIHLKPEKFEYGGVSFMIEQADKLQGIAFVVCIVFYLGAIGTGLMFQTQFMTSDRAIKRRLLYAALDGKKTLVGRDRKDVLQFKMKARLLYRIALGFVALAMFFPLIHILFFQQAAFIGGLDAIFHTNSMEDGRINLTARVPLLLTLALMIVWTSLVHRFSVKALRMTVPGWDRSVFINMVSAVTFAYLDSKFRGQEVFSEAFFRIAGAQTLIFILYLVPHAIVFPFVAWYRIVGFLRSLRGGKKGGK
ncbi:hypothetical protein [Bradyrhizobium pachyrhizi]|uniref:hypothetical protein n=1 Tax=Bradyrhizobium pachyrhizi TaxID=280333 RepID=UPI003D36044D